MSNAELLAVIQSRYTDIHDIPKPAGQARGDEQYFDVPATRLVELCQFLKSDTNLSFDYLSFMTAIDWKTHFEVVYYLFSNTFKQKVVIKVKLENREKPEIPTVTGIWPTADWQEREAFDLFGIYFTGHYNMRRILLPEDWEGYPLRKDYVPKPDRYD